MLFAQVPGDAAKSPTSDSEIAAADRLYRSGKFAAAEASYRALVKNDTKLVPAQVGLVRSMLRQQKIDEAFDAANAALAEQPNSAALLAAKGDVQFRLGAMSDAELSYLAAKKHDPKEVHSYLGLARIYRAYSMYGVAYGELKIAHDIAPNDIDVQMAWLRLLPRKGKLASLEAYLAGPHAADADETEQLTERLEFLRKTADKPPHDCQQVSKVEQTEIKLSKMYAEARRRWASGLVRGVSLSATINDQNAEFQLDTGASGIIIGRKVAENAGLTRISTVHYGGIGDRGSRTGYTAVADHIRIGDLEFQDCLVVVSNQAAVLNETGLLGADVFATYLVDIDIPEMRLKLSPLPKRPEDTVAPKSLNSNGDEQANTDDQRETAANADSGEQKSAGGYSSAQSSGPPDSKTFPQPASPPKDRYVAREMANWTKVFRFGHLILVPTNVNDSKPMLFGLDTGAFDNMLSLRAGSQMGKVSPDYFQRVRGLSGTVNEVYRSNATLRFARVREQQNIVTFDLSGISGEMGTEISGFLGFDMLRLLDVKIDYRDGLVDFEYGRK